MCSKPRQILEQTLAAENDKRAKAITENLGYVEASWKNVKAAISDAVDALLQWGRTETGADKLKAARANINFYNNAIEENIAEGMSPTSPALDVYKQAAQAAIDEEARLLKSMGAVKDAAADQAAAVTGVHQQEAQAAIAAEEDFKKLTASLDKTALAQEKIHKAASLLYTIYPGRREVA
jgi:phage-related minor tail protein